MKKKLVILGLDGATFDLILPWIEKGWLPNIDRIISEGSWGYLKSTIPHNSAVAWTSFITGKNPGNHGIYDFYYRTAKNYDINFIDFNCIRGKAFWDVIGEAGGKVGVINVPVTYPAPEINGYLISGLMAPEVNEKAFYPRDLYGELISKVGDFDVRVYAKDYLRFQKFDQLFQKIMDVVDKRYTVLNYLMETRHWDALCYVFSGTDFVQHFFWVHSDKEHPLHNRELGKKFGNCMLRVYQKIDSLVGELVRKLPSETSILIMSDHGAGPNSNRAIFLNNWLAQEGFLAFSDNDDRWRPSSAYMLRNLISLGRKYIPRKYKDKIKQFARIKSKSHSYFRFSGIDWSHTKAFSDDNRGTIWVNLKGRNAQGTVEPGSEYEEIRDLIIQKAKGLRDPETGEIVFEDVLKREEVYFGKYVDKAPDILLLQAKRKYTLLYRLSNANRRSDVFRTFTFRQLTETQPAANASHRQNGILIMKGPHIRRGHRFSGAKIIDIAPTVLYLMNLAIPEDMDGKVLGDAIDPGYWGKYPPRFCRTAVDGPEEETESVLSEDEADQVRRNLQGLGYLE